MDQAQASTLPPPAGDNLVFYANAIDQAQYGNHGMYGTLFRRARWRRGN